MPEPSEELPDCLSPVATGWPDTYPSILLDNLPQCVYLKDRRLRFVAANPAFCTSLGRNCTDLLRRDDFAWYARPLAELYRGQDRRVLELGESLEGSEERTFAGKPRTVQVTRTPVRGRDGAVWGVLGVFWDVTEQRRLEAQLRQGQKMEAVAQLAGGIAHDFNNLLTGILGNLALIRAGLSVVDHAGLTSLHDHLGSAERVGRRAAELVAQLLAFARRLQARFEPLDLNRAVEEVARALCPELGTLVTVEVRPQPDLWPVEADRAQVQRVLTNLCLNARDAMPHGGRLVLETGNVVLDREGARAHLEGWPGEFVCVRVSDTGEGIPADVLPRIFDPFFTTKDLGKGSGLGLAMAFGIVKEHRGWITGRSQLGKGSRFEVYLPRAALLPQQPATDRSPADTPAGRTDRSLRVYAG
jgi:PAS domain S-box-containing protein